MIDLAQLPPEGATASGAAASLDLGDGTVLRDASWRVRVLPSDGDYFLEVKGAAVWEGACSRCLEPLDLSLELESRFLGSRDAALVSGGNHVIGSQDLDVVFLPEPAVDEEALAVEHFQLHAPMHPLCREDCAGLCPQCGKNWNKGPCSCRPDIVKEPGALAKALSGLKLNLEGD
ncbi:YceD family protein [Mesoterricola sediminis]|uniref:DUF177 domain-containing protein n=1 Tax=Mesoterricola sediminis TaxID=2927980 RepID=A0AA48KE33_9BACT|nr:YceD family protein [Mesoterricola sediminis]BDU78846.1 hypothetical protein METESE_38040 [Mesoterricola sediminis]